MVRAEVAAWRVLRALEWTELMAATVLRRLAIDEQRLVDASLQVAWPDYSWCPSPEVLDEDDILRAAVFDVVVGVTDRKDNNWLGVGPEGGPQRLKLIDHGHAFDFPGRAFASTFFELKEWEALDEKVVTALRRVGDDGPELGLGELLSDAQIRALRARADGLASGERLVLP